MPSIILVVVPIFLAGTQVQVSMDKMAKIFKFHCRRNRTASTLNTQQLATLNTSIFFGHKAVIVSMISDNAKKLLHVLKHYQQYIYISCNIVTLTMHHTAGISH